MVQLAFPCLKTARNQPALSSEMQKSHRSLFLPKQSKLQSLLQGILEKDVVLGFFVEYDSYRGFFVLVNTAILAAGATTFKF